MLPWRRGSKNSGGGIAPAAIGVLIEGRSGTVNAFDLVRTAVMAAETPHKALARLNFRHAPGIG
jgi:hypothetical protein